ncbi:MAG: uroporphyrinogen decarboxylase family protein [Spirochaetia bacterium]
MSFEAGWNALHGIKHPYVSRTEYSAQNHWPLVKAVTGIDTDKTENRDRARQEFIKAWDYAFMWNILIHRGHLSNGRTVDMGHAVYSENEEGKGDYREKGNNVWEDLDEAYSIDFFKEYGTLPHKEIVNQFNDHYRESCDRWPDTVNMTGIYITLISGLIEIFGWETLLLLLGSDKERFSKLIDRYAEWIRPFFDALKECESEIVMVHDDMVWTSGPFFDPAWYRSSIFPHTGKHIRMLKDAGKTVIFTCDGTYTEFIDDIADWGVDSMVMEPTTDMSAVAKRHGSRVGFVGGVDTRVLLSGSPDEIDGAVKQAMEIGKEYPGFIIAVGNHIPQNTPVESALRYQEAYLKYRNR